jgi:hypothetical protein
MSRSRLCALALVPLLLAGAAACGGGDEVPAERRAAADAAFAALEEHRGPWPSCGQWLDASDSVRSAMSDDLAQETRDIDMDGADVGAGLDRACRDLDEKEPFSSAVIDFAMDAYDLEGTMEEVFRRMIAEGPAR